MVSVIVPVAVKTTREAPVASLAMSNEVVVIGPGTGDAPFAAADGGSVAMLYVAVVLFYVVAVPGIVERLSDESVLQRQGLAVA